MKPKKSRLSMAMGAVLSAAMLAPATTFGVTFDVGTGPHEGGSTTPRVKTHSGGDALLFPIYTTVDGATTSFSVTNDSSDEVAAIKIRFREQEHSMDVLDFIVVMSPEDKFDFWVSQGPDDERPVMGWNDNSCVIGPDGNSVMFPPPNTPFVTTNEQMQVGHLEVLGTRDLSGTCWDGGDGFALTKGNCSDSEPYDISVGAMAIHGDDGKPADCDTLVDLLSDPELTYLIDSHSFDLDDVLLGRYVITAGADGVEAAGDPLEIGDSDLRLFAQSNASCAEYPDEPGDSAGMCSSYYAWDGVAWDHPHLGEMDNYRLANLQLLTGAEEVAGDWSNNPANAVGVDWVLTFFSKYAYLDYISLDACELSGGSAKAWCLLSTTPLGEGEDPGWAGVNGIWTEESTTNTCLVDNDIEVWGREEDKASGNVNVSPGQRETLDLCNEVNVFTLASDEGAAPRDSLIQTNDRRSVIGFKNLEALRGWAKLTLAFQDNDVVDGVDAGATLGGLIFTTRATDDPNHNNGSITEIKKPDTFCGGGFWCLPEDQPEP